MEKHTTSRKKWITHWLPMYMWMSVIFFLSSRHSVVVSQEYFLNFLFFKSLHLIEYAILFTLVTRVTQEYAKAFVITVLYAMTDEIHQQFIPSREGRLRDVIIDSIGAGFVWIFLVTQLPRMPKKLKDLAKRLDIPYS